MEQRTINELKKALQAAENELVTIKEAYNTEIEEMREEIAFLKERSEAQHGMLADAIHYSTNLEKKLNQLTEEIKSDSFQSIH